MPVSKSAQAILRFAAVVAIDALIVWIFYRGIHVNPTTVGFTFLLAILAVAASWGLHYAVVMAVVATLAYNYFFLPPVLRFTIADPQNWVALFAFLFTAIVASQLSERARREATESDERRSEVERLYSFSQALLVSDNVYGLLNLIPKYAVDSFGVTSAAMFVEGKETYFYDVLSQSLFPSE